MDPKLMYSSLLLMVSVEDRERVQESFFEHLSRSVFDFPAFSFAPPCLTTFLHSHTLCVQRERSRRMSSSRVTTLGKYLPSVPSLFCSSLFRPPPQPS